MEFPPSVVHNPWCTTIEFATHTVPGRDDSRKCKRLPIHKCMGDWSPYALQISDMLSQMQASQLGSF